MVNAAEATIQGIELEATFRPIERFTLSGFWGYTDASFDKFIDPFTGADLSNQDFARVPKNNWRLTGSVDLIRSPDIGDVSFTEAYRSEEHTSELQSRMRISYAVFCLKKKITTAKL